MKKALLFSSLVLAFGLGATAATKGSCESAAADFAVGKSKTVKLVAEYDPDEKEYDSDSGVYYLSVKLSRGSSYTITYSGVSADNVGVSGYPRDATEKEEDSGIDAPGASFSDEGEFNGVYVQYLQEDEWYADDPAKWTFYIEVRGDVGDSITVSLVEGITPFATPGTPENPSKLSFSDSGNSSVYSFVDGEYYFTSSLKAGRFYRIRTTSGTSAAPVLLDVDSEGSDFGMIPDTAYSADTNNSAYIIVPATSSTFYFVAHGVNATFGLQWQSIPTRSPAAHPSLPLEVSNGYSASFTPGRVNSSYNFADDIIDEGLCRIELSKGERWVFETTGATVESEMRLYDSKGNILAVNGTVGNGSFDTLVAYEVKTAGTYYVGVCEPALGVADAPTGSEVTLTAVKVLATDGEPDAWDAADDTVEGASPISPLPISGIIKPVESGASHGPHRLGATDWADTFVIAARKGITYVLAATPSGAEYTDLTLKAEVFTISNSREKAVSSVTGGIDISEDDYLTFVATENAAYYIRVSVAEGIGLTYPGYTLYAAAYTKSEAGLGILTVNTPGAPSATWSIGSESVKYPSGSSVLVSGTQTIKFSKVKGYNAEVASKTVTVASGTTPTVVEVVYSDTFDPKDDTVAGATSVSFKNVDTVYATRTLWKGDKADNFAFDGKDGYYYDIALRNVEGNDVTFSISNAGKTLVEGVTSVSQMAMPKTSSKYYVTVVNGAGASVYGGYTLAGKFADVGAIKFAKTAVNAKEDAASVVLAVNRTAKDGYVRVKYGTVAGSALPGEDYVAQNGVLEWANGDNKAKTITVKLIPDLVPFYEGNKTFSVRLAAFGEDELAPGEYPVSIVGGDSCLVTLTETTKPGTTPESAYAKKAPKMATVKTEAVPLETGSFYGVLEEDGSALTNGLPALASIAFTASTASPAALSAKVALAGKTYTFSAKGWDDDAPDGFCTKEFLLDQKVNRINEETGKSESAVVTSTLRVTVASGATAATGDWLKAGGTVELVMNVPDANNKGYQEDIRYVGAIYRDNSKIQDYLKAVLNFTGYYTVALAPEGVSPADGVPAGNGYLTLTIDNKGAVKAAGMLADGATKPSLTAKACALVPDKESSNGYSMVVPLFFAKAPAVFGGELRLYADESGKVVVDSSRALSWNNDNAKLTYAGEEGYALALDPVGGFYDTVVNLQAYYLNHSFEVGTAEISEFPLENLSAGYAFATSVEPNGTPVSLGGDTFSTAKHSLVKNGKLYDLAASVNPCNVQVKVVRATGLVSGSFSLWSESGAGAAQKELTGFKHNGVLVLARDKFSPLADEVAAAGFCFKAVKVTDVNPNTGKTSTRNWTFSLPFNLLAIDQGETDPWADDWGEAPVFGE